MNFFEYFLSLSVVSRMLREPSRRLTDTLYLMYYLLPVRMCSFAACRSSRVLLRVTSGCIFRFCIIWAFSNRAVLFNTATSSRMSAVLRMILWHRLLLFLVVVLELSPTRLLHRMPTYILQDERYHPCLPIIFCLRHVRVVCSHDL